MKPQVILFALLQAQAALSDEGSPAMLPDCALPCKTNLRLGASKLSECVRSHCEAQFQMKEEGENVAQPPNACVARCLRLRFSPARQEQCIENCDRDEEDGDSDRSVPDAEVAEYDAEEEGEDIRENDDQSPNACVARCLRLRFSPARQDQCIKNCDRDEEDGDSDRSVPDEEVAEYDAEEEGEDVGENDDQSPNACVARCLRLRFTPARQEQCIENCDRDKEDGDSDRSVPDTEVVTFDVEEEGEDVGENDAQSPNACVARCLRLRFTPARQEQCIENCDRDEEDRDGSVPDMEMTKYDAEEEGEDVGENDDRSPNACAARCLRLRFSLARQEQCIENCDRDEEDGNSDSSVPDAEVAEYGAEEEGEDVRENVAQSPNACVARCLRLRFGPARQEQCILNCGQEGGSSRESISKDVGDEHEAYAATA